MTQKEKISLTREAIATRMFRNAAKHWGISDANVENFDPLVRMLIEACAVEMHRISNQIETVQERMIEKLAGLLTPQVFVIPKPAHGVLHARSMEVECTLSNKMQFYHQKKVASKSNAELKEDIYFSPSGQYKGVDGDVKYIVTGNYIYGINGDYLQKEILATTPNSLSYRTAWVGIDISSDIEDITGLSLFFDLKNIPEKDKYMSLVPFTHCSVNGTPVLFHKGIFNNVADSQNIRFNNSMEELYVNNRMEHMVEDYYKNQFITVGKENTFLQKISKSGIKQKYPVEFGETMGSKELQLFKTELVWVKLVFRPEFTTDVLEDLTIAINCFPVLNRHLNNTTYRLQSFFNIIPLTSNEQFLSIDKVESTLPEAKGDKEYKYYSFDQFDKSEKGTYAIRQGDLERFDSRNAMEYMNYLVDLLRDESRAFAALGQDFIATLIKNLNQNIAQIEQKIKLNAVALNSIPAYLLINPIAEGDTVFTQFWTCNGETGNGIRSGTKMELYEGSVLKREGIVLMTTTTGGTNKLKNTETLPAYKSVLISRGRIVTQEDIKAFCYYYLKDKAAVRALEVKKGVGISTKPQEGLIPTVDINIITVKNEQLGPEEWEAIKHELLVSLEAQSAVDLNYRVFVN